MKHLTDDEIDKIVVDEADKRLAWEEPVRVKRPKGRSVRIPPNKPRHGITKSRR